MFACKFCHYLKMTNLLSPYQDLTFIKERKSAATGQSRAAAKLTQRSTKMLKPLHIDQNARLIV
ncbi:hypothetical protein T06_12455 [Trichinella sp. T6]|nr:hypothetical protein T06_12455 [Trichinella sp. T6]